MAHTSQDENSSKTRASWTAIEGSPRPLGVSWVPDEAAYNFALYSKNATGVTLLIYGDDISTPLLTKPLDHLANKSGRVWHCRVPRSQIAGARYYAYSVAGPESRYPFLPHAFDAEKILLDPYAESIHVPPTFDRSAAIGPGSNSGRAMVGRLPELGTAFDWQGDCSPRHESDLIIYEFHVRGFTQSPTSGVPEARKGTFLGVIDKIPYLTELGVTAVELMPVFQFGPGEGNYWGYMPLGFFAPHHAYATRGASADPHNEFREMVRALHAAGIEVILDVVYNHTAEGDARGPTYNFRGIDNSTYYELSGDPHAPYCNFSGAGNTLHCANRAVRRMIRDSLRYWVTEMHVDGFRFDLASVFSRGGGGAVNFEDPPIFGDITSSPALANVRLIAEPWDAAGMYQLGRSFPGASWSQWNGRFRDDIRQFVRGDRGMVGALMQRLYGSDDLFPDSLEEARHPYQSVNYVTAHDGFTLYDLVSYSKKRNWANGHGNTDGLADEYSSNCGHEGDDHVPPGVLALRKRQAKNFLCLLMLANGTPMIRAGDELLRTQRGNSNPYNQDSPLTWIDWTRKDRFADVFRFVRLLIAFRKAHPTLCRSRFWREDIRWYGPRSEPDLGYDSHTLAYLLRGASQRDVDLYVMINGSDQELPFLIQEPPAVRWRRVIDTGLPSPDDICPPESVAPLSNEAYTVKARSVVVLMRP